MFVIDSVSNTIKSLSKKTFAELGFKERTHLQEWIAGNPDSLGEKLLIIQKEFSGFLETSERLDLLAIDKNGDLVIIENKLDDSGKDVTWQALKYASYCSTLTKEQIIDIFQIYLNATKLDAQKVILDFLDEVEYSELVLNQNQRIIFIAANFRKEVTSTALWLMAHKIKIQCFKATPYEFQQQYFLTLDQIIPTKDAQDYVISMTNKAQEENYTEETIKNRHKIRLRFWAEFLKAIKAKSTLFQSSNPTKEYALAAGGPGITYVTYQVVISGNRSWVTLNFGRSSQEENKILFDALAQHKEHIEATFGEYLIWERNDELKKSAVSYYKEGQNYFNEEEWPDIVIFLIEYINKLERATKPYFTEIKNTLANSIKDIKEPLEEEQN